MQASGTSTHGLKEIMLAWNKSRRPPSLLSWTILALQLVITCHNLSFEHLERLHFQIFQIFQQVLVMLTFQCAPRGRLAWWAICPQRRRWTKGCQTYPDIPDFICQVEDLGNLTSRIFGVFSRWIAGCLKMPTLILNIPNGILGWQQPTSWTLNSSQKLTSTSMQWIGQSVAGSREWPRWELLHNIPVNSCMICTYLLHLYFSHIGYIFINT
jgi:hypothetical protein